MGRPVLAQADRVVAEDEDRAYAHQRRHADRIAGVIGKDQKGTAVGAHAAVQLQAIHDRRHAELAHAVMHVVAGRIRGRQHARGAVPGVVRAGQVGRSADPLRQGGGQRIEGRLRRRPGGDAGRLGLGIGNGRRGTGREALRQLAGEAALELGGQLRVGRPVVLEELFPLRLVTLAPGTRVPAGADVGRHLEGGMRPVDGEAGRGDFRGSQRLAVHRLRAGLGRRTKADHGLAADQRRLAGLAACLADRTPDRLRVVPVDGADHLPAVGLEAPRGVVGEPALDLAVDRNAVVIVESDQLAEAERAGQRTGLVRNAFHQAAVAEEGIGMVVDDLKARPVEGRRQMTLGEGEADRIGDALAQRAGRRLDTEACVALGMAGRMRAHLPEMLDVLDRQRIAGQMQHGVEQHRTVAIGQNEAISVGPARIRRTVAQEIVPEHLGDIRHAHRHARMA